MRQIINPWLEMQGYNCFGCCATNPHGMHMQFYDADPADLNAYVYSVFQPTYDHQSWLNTLHGGLQATLLDEVCGWIVFAKMRTSGVTAKMDIRYRKAVSTVNGPIVLRAKLEEEHHRVASVKGEIWTRRDDSELTTNTESSQTLTDDDFLQANYQLAAECECTYFSFNQQKAEQMGYREPSVEQTDYLLSQIIELARLRSKDIRYKSLRTSV